MPLYGLRTNSTGALVTTDAHGTAYESTSRDNVFSYSRSAVLLGLIGGIVLRSAPTLINGVGAQGRMTNTLAIVHKIILTNASSGVGFSAIAIVWGFVQNLSATFDNASIITNNISVSSPQNAVTTGRSFMRVSATVTLNATPNVLRPLTSFDTVSSNTINADIAGSIIVPPGIYISLQSTIDQTNISATYVWEELDTESNKSYLPRIA